MSRLNELIAELCPDGVEYKTIKSVCSLFAGGDVPKDRLSDKKTDEYSIPIYSNGIDSNALYGWTDTYKINKPCITIAARGTIGYCALREEPFFPVVRLICAIPNDSINVRFLKYATETLKIQVPTSGIPQLTVPMLAKYKIPLPPLPVQQEIVRILDNFTELTEELTAELTARKKQYEYYRDELLTFDKDTIASLTGRKQGGRKGRLNALITELCPDGVEYINFGSAVTENLGGGTPSKSKSRYWNGGIPWASVKDVVRAATYLCETIDTISHEGLNSSPSNLIPKGWLIICTRINPGLAVIAGTDMAINQDLRAIRFRDDVDAKFMYYFFQTLNITGKGTTVKGISVDELDRIKIPLPPLLVQREIVRILDNFTELTAELTVELTLRKSNMSIIGANFCHLDNNGNGCGTV